MPIALITVPYTSTGLTTGEARAPSALRDAGLVEALRLDDDAFVDLGDVAFASPSPVRDARSGVIAPETLTSLTVAVRDTVAMALGAGRFPVVVGGECPLLLGCLAAARDRHGRVGLLFIDGHEDAWPPHGSTTGEAADMELGLALGTSEIPELPDLAGLLPLVRPEDTVILGARDQQEILDAGEASLADVTTVLSDADALQADLSELGRTLAEDIRLSAGAWWLHVDLDVLSSDALSAVRYPQPGGFSWSQLEQVVSTALTVPGLVGWNLTIYNPDLDRTGEGATRIVDFVRNISPALGRLRT